MKRAHFAGALWATLFAIGVTQPAAAVTLAPGDFVLAGSASGSPALMKLDGATLETTSITSGGLAGSALDIVVTRSGRILMAVPAGVVEVDAGTGAESYVLSSTELGGTPRGICEGVAGEMFLSIAGTGARVVRWTPGAPVTDVSSDGLLDNPGGLELAGDGMLYVANTRTRSTSTNAWYGGIVRVNPSTGAQEIVSEDSDLYGPFDLTFGPDGFIWTVNLGHVAGRNGCPVRTDPVTGESAPAGSTPCRSIGLARGLDGRMLLSDCSTVGPDCQLPIVLFADGPVEHFGLGGRVAVVPAGVTPTLRRSWGQLKAIYR